MGSPVLREMEAPAKLGCHAESNWVQSGQKMCMEKPHFKTRGTILKSVLKVQNGHMNLNCVSLGKLGQSTFRL